MDLMWFIQLAITTLLGIFAYFIKNTFKNIEDSITKNNDDIEKIKEEFNILKTELPKTYVMRDDFIRAMSNVDSKLDKIYDIVTSKKGGE